MSFAARGDEKSARNYVRKNSPDYILNKFAQENN